jgi:hypothetical protein
MTTVLTVLAVWTAAALALAAPVGAVTRQRARVAPFGRPAGLPVEPRS